MEIEKLLMELTLEEKASLISGGDFWHTKGVERLGIPAVMVSDGPHGLRKQDETMPSENDSIQAVCFPTGCAVAASFDPELACRMGQAIGDSAQHEGLAVVLGPAVNIKRSPLCGRNFEYYSEDPLLAGRLAARFIRGVQSRGVGTSLKHFVANNQEHRRMSSSSNMDERTLREIYLPAFEQAVKEGRPWTVMCSYNRVNGEQVSESKRLLTQILREEWGFDGLVVSDWGAVNDRIKGVQAGLDLEMPSSAGENDRRVVEAVKKGDLSMEALDRCVENVLTLIDRAITHQRPDTPWNKEEQHQLARELATECMVLMKNEDDLLPLSKEVSLAVVGAFAKKPRFQGGGSSHINCAKITSFMDAVDKLPKVRYAEGYRGNEPEEELLEEAVALAKEAEVAVVFAGLPDSFECEGYDREHLSIPRSHEELIRRVAEANPNTVVVLHNGSPVEMPWLPKVKAVLEAYLAGEASGGAVADLLLGERCPCGRLPESFPLRLQDNPSFPWYGGEGDEADYQEGVFVGYRWYDKRQAEVLFPFGFGLSYTDFAYAGLRLSAREIKDTEPLTVSLEITNTGRYTGKEVVQVYVAPPKSEWVIRPARELRAFAKVELRPGETKRVELELERRAFAYWNHALNRWEVESGEYTVQIGRSSRDIVLEERVMVKSTQEKPARYHMNTLLGDILESERARAAFAPLFALMQESAQQSQAANEAITPEMNAASFRYSPLRAVLSFRPGAICYKQLQEMIDQANREETGR